MKTTIISSTYVAKPTSGEVHFSLCLLHLAVTPRTATLVHIKKLYIQKQLVLLFPLWIACQILKHKPIHHVAVHPSYHLQPQPTTHAHLYCKFWTNTASMRPNAMVNIRFSRALYWTCRSLSTVEQGRHY